MENAELVELLGSLKCEMVEEEQAVKGMKQEDLREDEKDSDHPVV